MFDRVNVFTHIHIHKEETALDRANRAEPRLTVGSMMVNLEFNPSGDTRVDQVKGATASIIDGLEQVVTNRGSATEAARCARIAQQKYEEACMYAVKALTRST